MPPNLLAHLENLCYFPLLLVLSFYAVCTSLESSITSVPPVSFFGSNFVFYIAIHSHPRPTANMVLQIGTYYKNRIGQLIEHPSFKAPLLVFEFSTAMPLASEVNNNLSYFTVKFNSSNDLECTETRSYIYPIPVANQGGYIYHDYIIM